MKPYVLIAVAVLFPITAFGQSSGGVVIDSVRAPFSIKMTYTLTFQTESLNSLGKLVANPGQIKKVGVVDLIKDSVILAEIPGPKTVGAKTIVSSIKATFATEGGLGFTIDPVVAHVKLPNVELPAGQTLALRYDMPAQTFDVVSLKWGPAGSGRLQWKVGVGVLAKDISKPVDQIWAVTPAPGYTQRTLWSLDFATELGRVNVGMKCEIATLKTAEDAGRVYEYHAVTNSDNIRGAAECSLQAITQP